ncbi:MAG: DUF2059 domain-containing protein [Chromatiales bacterium]|nr:DUF2059 domain-containing protein [Chromatiales bacterium]
MRRIIRTISLVALVAACQVGLVTAHAAESIPASYQAAASQLLDFVRTETHLAALRAAIVAQEIQRDKRLKEHRGHLEAHVVKHMGWEATRADIVQSYYKIFTEEDLRSLLAFYRSPVGQKVIEHMQRLNHQAFAAGARRSQDHHEELKTAILGSDTQKQ